MNPDEQRRIAEVEKAFNGLRENIRSLVLATTGRDGTPSISYAPFVTDETNSFIVYVSRLSARTSELSSSRSVAVMLIEDEAGAKQIFARKRVTYRCKVEEVDRGDPQYERLLDKMSDRFGGVLSVLRSLSDFHLFRLAPVSGRFVTGFGQAYELTGERLDALAHIGPGQIRKS